MRLTLASSLLLFLLGTAPAQTDVPARYVTLTAADGLPDPSVFQLHQDRKGFVWIVTPNGISRYDGNRIRTYNPIAGLTADAPTRNNPYLHESIDSTVWVGYVQDRHVWRFDHLRDTFVVAVRLPADTSDRRRRVVRAIFADPGRALWVSSSGDGVYRYPYCESTDRPEVLIDSTTYRHFTHDPDNPQSLPGHWMSAGIEKIPDGRLLFATETGLAVLNAGGHFTTYNWGGPDTSQEIVGFCPDTARSCVWMNAVSGLLRFDYDDDRLRWYSTPEEAGSDFVGQITLGRNNNLFLSIDGFPNNNLWNFYPASESFEKIVAEINGRMHHLPGAYGITTDRNGQIWSGNFRRGVQIIEPDPAGLRRIGFPARAGIGPDFNDRAIHCVTETEPGRFFLGTREQGLWEWIPATGTLRAWPMPSRYAPEGGAWVQHITYDAERERIWVFADRLYAVSINDRSWRRIEAISFVDNDLSRFTTLLGGELWVVRSGHGVSRLRPLDGSLINHYSRKDGVYGGSLIRADTTDGAVYLPTSYNGFFEKPPGRDTFIRHLPGHTVYDVAVRPDGLLWISSPAGPRSYDPVTRQTIPLPGGDVELSFPNYLHLDTLRGLYVQHRDGIALLDWRNGRLLREFRADRILSEDGEWLGNNVLLSTSSRGALLTPNQNGLFTLPLHPDDRPAPPPPVRLVEWKTGEHARPLPRTPSEKITVTNAENNLRFHLAVLDFKVADRNQVSHFLEGFDQDWRLTTPDRPLEYPNLASGTYRLRAVGINADGVKGEETLLATVRILPPWYAHPVAYLFYALLLASGVYALYRFQLRRRRRELDYAYLRELDSAKTNLFTNISHEFRTPLTLILGEAQLLLGRLNEILRPHAQRIRHSGERLLWLVSQLLELAQADSGFLRIEARRADIIPFLRYSLQSFASLTDPRNITLTFDSSVDELEMDFDPERLQRALSNLLLNAVKFTPDGGRIKLKVSGGTAGNFELKILDSGPGIPPAELPLVFDRFHRATRREGGVGIGLALTKELVEKMGGTITAANRPEGGAVFTALLPVTRNAPLRPWEDRTPLRLPSQAAVGEPPVAPPSLNGNRPKVLLIEDDVDLRAFLQATLYGDYELSLAGDGVDGLELARDQAFDLIVSDVMMPRMDGFAVCEALKTEFSTSHLPVILLTARADKASRLEGFRKGADAYLAKPFEPDELRIRCRQLLDQRKRMSDYFHQLLGSNGQNGTAFELPQAQRPELDFLLHARAVVEAHLDDHFFTPSTLAGELELSRSQLHRKLTQLAGLSTTHFIRRVRVQRAEQMLLHQGDLSIADVAYCCGFSDPGYFSRVFREIKGISPSEYRERGGDEE